MKKLMIALAAVAFATMANAAAVTWNTGTLYVPNADGTWSTGGVKASGDNPGTWLAKVTFYADNDGVKGSVFTPTGTGSLSSSTVSGMGNISSKVGDSGSSVFAISTAYWMDMVITYTTSDKIYTWTLEPAKFITKGAGDTTVNIQQTTAWADATKKFTTDNTFVVTSNVPEPSSALVLLLGVGLMALRRKQA